VGFGGHLKAGDIKGKMSDWLQREFDEEISAEAVSKIKFLGIVDHNGDEDNGVHKVHFGLVFEITTEGMVGIREDENFQDAEFLTIEELQEKTDEMELWSRLVIQSLSQSDKQTQ
jgi:predicted NUDIX family phosphoesterase